MRVALADDSNLFREGIGLLLSTAGVEVVLQARTGQELLTRLLGTSAADLPDAVVLDIRMPPSFTDEGLVAAAQLRSDHPNLGILVLSAYVETTYVVRLLRDGASGMGMLSKDRVADLPTLLDALTRVAAGETVIDQEVVGRLLSQPSRVGDLDRLGDREQEVLRLMAEGRSNSGIAEKLQLSERTIETHTANIFDKLLLEPAKLDNRRVLAVLTWLRENPAAARLR